MDAKLPAIENFCTECGIICENVSERSSHTCNETFRFKLVRAYKGCYANSSGYMHYTDEYLAQSLSHFYETLCKFHERMKNSENFPRKADIENQMKLIEEAFS